MYLWLLLQVVRLSRTQILTSESSCPDYNASHPKPSYTRLYRYLTGTGAHNFRDSITIGFLGAYGHTPFDLGALPLAVNTVNNDSQLLPGVRDAWKHKDVIPNMFYDEGRRLQYLAADIGKNTNRLAALAIRVMTEMRDNGTVAFIGPDDTCRSEALVAAAWNLPMISYKCAESVSDKRVYSTFARTLPPSYKVSKSVVALLRHFQWTTFVIVAGKRPAWGVEVQNAIKELAEIYKMNITEICRLPDEYITTVERISEVNNIVTKTFQKTRVYVFIGEHIALVDFVYCLQTLDLLDKGEYIIISVDDEIYDPDHRLNIMHREYIDPHRKAPTFRSKVIQGFQSVLKLTPSHSQNSQYKEVCEQIKKFSLMPPFCVPYHRKLIDSISVPIDAAHLYDAVMIYARALTEVLSAGEDPRNGSAILQRIRNRSYKSIQGYDVFIDGNGDAEGNYTVVALLEDQNMSGSFKKSMQPVGYFQYAPDATSDYDLPEFKYFEDHEIDWVAGAQPLAVPPCGFHGEKCTYRPDWWHIVIPSILLSLLLLGIIFAFKHYRYEQKLACLLWKIDMREVIIIPTETAEASNRSMIQVCRQSLFLSGVHFGSSLTTDQHETGCPKRAYTRIGLYRGNIVAIKPVYKRSIDITRSIRKELKQIREVRHENLIPFIGASVDHGQLCILTAYCARGSLEDVLANKDLHLDNMFVSSLISDILKGMIYLHDSEIVSHGNLRSSNCLIDSRWVVQITDFGLHEFRAGQEEPDHQAREERRALWRAPELLRSLNPPARGTQKGDVYSFSIVLYEIMGRCGPWGNVDISEKEIVERVKNPGTVPVCRPLVESLMAEDYVIQCMKSCWDEDPEQRPDIRYVRVKLKELQSGLKPNIFDNMLAIMEKYAYNLEGLVQERTNQLMEEKKKTDALLHRMLPKTVAEALKRGDPVEAESFDCVTIYFSDIVGFTELSAVSTPLQVVDLLNDLYTCCDSIISHYDVYKVETIGDAYMVVSGLPERNGDRHAGEIASMALHLLTKIKHFEIRHRRGEHLRLRIGVHSGHCVAGVVGLKMPRYCLFGDTVNTASRMESSGEAFKIHISEATHMLLQRLGGYHCEERGLIPIKGKGEMRTYWLLGEDPVRRLERIREERALGSSLGSISSERLSGLETPDLLRHPGEGSLSRQQLHMRAVRCYSKQQDSETMSCMDMLHDDERETKNERRGYRSAPTITFRDIPVHYV